MSSGSEEEFNSVPDAGAKPASSGTNNNVNGKNMITNSARNSHIDEPFTLAEVQSAFEAAGNPIKNGVARCLCHEDKKPSLGVSIKGGNLVVHCHAGCNQGEVFRACRQMVRPNGRASKVVPYPSRKQSRDHEKNEVSQSAETFEKLWAKMASGASTYCERKGVGAYGLKVKKDGSTAIPARSNGGTGQIVGIYYQESRLFEKGSTKKRAAHLISKPNQGAVVLVCEGYATAASAFEASGRASADAFGAKNLIQVAEALQKQGFDAVVCPDDDKTGQGEARDARAAGYRVILPSFHGIERGQEDNDWNDLARLAGIEEVKRQIEAGLSLPQQVEAVSVAANQDEQKPKKRRKKDKAVYGDYIDLLEQTYPAAKPRLDLVTDIIHVLHDKKWQPCGRGTRILGRISSEARDSHGFFDATNDALLSHFDKYAQTKKPELLIDVEEWDGKERLRLLAEAINASYTPEITYEIIVDWCVKAWRKVWDPEVQNEVLLLQGDQGIGKDAWIGALIGAFQSNNGRYVSHVKAEKIEADDWSRMATSSIIIFIDEWDKLTISNGSLKSRISMSSTSWTPKYQEHQVTRLVRASIIASTNPKDINSDPTGARRYIPVEIVGKPFDQCRGDDVPAIRWNHYRNAKDNPRQILAEIVHKAATWAGVSETTRAAIKAVQERHTPEDPWVLCREAIFDEARQLSDYRNAKEEQEPIEGQLTRVKKMPNSALEHIITAKAKEYELNNQKLRTRLKTAGYSKRNKSFTWFFIPIV